MSVFTYADAVDHLVDFVGGGASDTLHRDCRRAIQSAYREIATSHRWPYYYRSAAIVLDVDSDSYDLPTDFVAAGSSFRFGGTDRDLGYVPPDAWINGQRSNASSRNRGFYSIFGDPSKPGRLSLRINSRAGDSLDLRYSYVRRPRTLELELHNGVGSTAGPDLTVTSVPYLVRPGACVRLSATAKPPTGPLGSPSGGTPAVFEASVASFAATKITLDDTPPTNLTGVGYAISDPVDVEPGAMLDVFLRGAERYLAIARKLKDKPNVDTEYRIALEQAKAASSPSFGPRVAGPRCCGPVGLAAYRGQPIPLDFE